jgi:hypothetical protein
MMVVPRSRRREAIWARRRMEMSGSSPRVGSSRRAPGSVERLGEGEALLEPGGERLVLGLPVRPELALLDQHFHAVAQDLAMEPIEPAVERQHLGRAQAPHERRVPARHVEAPADGRGLADHVVA